jgi:hypothetical protein
MLEDDNFLDAAVFLSPPCDGMGSDEDSDLEEGFSADHLSSGQLSAPAEFVIDYGSEIVNSMDEEVQSTGEKVDLEEPMEDGLEGPMNEERNESPLITLSSRCPPSNDWKWVKKNLKNKIFPC